MVEKSFLSAHAPAFIPPPVAVAPVVHAITAVRYDGSQISEVMMGMIDPSFEHWDHRPAPTRLVEVVDRLVEGDTVVALFPTERGTLALGPQVKVGVLAEGTETLVMAVEQAGQRIADLPRF